MIKTEEKVGVVQKIRGFPEFLGKVRQEMEVVDRPSWQQVRSTTIVVILFLFVFALYLGALEWIFSFLDRGYLPTSALVSGPTSMRSHPMFDVGWLLPSPLPTSELPSRLPSPLIFRHFKMALCVHSSMRAVFTRA